MEETKATRDEGRAGAGVNTTGARTLDVIGRDVRIDSVYRDDDGIWIEPKRGWTLDPLSAHGGHATTAREALAQYRRIEACACRDCATAQESGR